MRFCSIGMASLLCCLNMVVVLSNPVRASDQSDRQDKLNGGYYLLHHLCDEESQLPMLAVIKTTPTEIVSYVNRIAKTANESITALDGMQDHDNAIRFDRNPLPRIERDIRESISDAKQHQLLFGTSNAAFVRALLVSQIEASNYALNIAKVLADQENDPTRVKALQNIKTKWQSIEDEAYRHLKQS
jgi:hypothetical protein